jgi:hypothetical protein
MRRLGWGLWGLLLLACSGTTKLEPAPDADAPKDDAGGTGNAGGAGGALGDWTSVSFADDDGASARQLANAFDTLDGIDPDGLGQLYPVEFIDDLGYDPLESEFLDLIQDSALALNDGELDKLGENGFLISTRQQFPTFVGGYAAIYSEDLPVYISADAMLDAVHRSYDKLLLTIEQAMLFERLETLLAEMHASLDSVDARPEAVEYVDLYLTVARSLLSGELLPGASSEAESLFDLAMAADGIETVDLFGVPRMMDFSQFVPRGHYEGNSLLERYFRSMMWLGRVDFRVIETTDIERYEVNRGQYEAMLAIEQLTRDEQLDLWGTIDTVIRAFVGSSDNMTVLDVPKLVDDLGGLDQALAADDDAIVEAFVNGGYGAQKIASYLTVYSGSIGEVPLNRSFRLFGQRYIPDSHVLSNVVYDRVAERLMPNPLDAAFAALGNNQALSLEADELETYPDLPEALGRMRVLLDGHGTDFWESNLYGLWTQALRALSPNQETADPEQHGLPRLAGSEAWGRRILNTQLGSWAELRHDTLLYAKQSYTGIPVCEFPDAYVDPYPEFYENLVRYAERGAEFVDALGFGSLNIGGPDASEYFETLRTTASTLLGMAENQRAGTPHTDEQLEFINDIVRIESVSVGCSSVPSPDGWYADLFFDPMQAIQFDPTIADVHTQPAEADGTIVGKVLHVGTGYPRLMVVTQDTCVGPRAYVGVAFAYHERVEEDFVRLTDSRWSQMLNEDGAQPDVAWMESLLY